MSSGPDPAFAASPSSQSSLSRPDGLQSGVGFAHGPPLWKLEDLVRHCTEGGEQAGLPDGRWVPARPLGFMSLGQRIKAAKLVLTGKADAVIWDGQ